MLRIALLSASLSLGLAFATNAAVPSMSIGGTESGMTKVAEGCGPGFWRGPNGGCHPFARGRVCPPGYHLGPQGGRCWPN